MSTIKNSLRNMKAESILTAAVIAMPIMTEFYLSIGMSYTQIGVSQAVFTAAVLALNVPTGWLADRFSRRWCNIAGDSMAAVGFILYAVAQSFFDVILAEIIIGIGLAFTNGVDQTLIRAYCRQLQVRYEKHWAFVTTYRPAAETCAVMAGGLIGAYSFRLAILLTAIPFIIGAVLSFWITDIGDRRIGQHRNPFKDMGLIIRYALHGHRQLSWTILSAAVAREITHPIIWLLTPLLLVAGVPIELLGVGWAVNLLATGIGAKTAGDLAHRLPEWLRFALPATASLVIMAALAVSTNLWTIGLYAVFGFVRGWYTAVMPPLIQAHTPNDIQTTVLSVSASIAQLLYIPTVIGINALADNNLGLSLLGSLLVFAPLVLLCSIKLRNYERR